MHHVLTAGHQGWPTRFAESLERSAGFGTVGARDTNNAQTMTLGASARLHIYIQHYFWPETLKNWYSDNYIQWVYGKYSVWMQDVLIRNSQKFGQRYGKSVVFASCVLHVVLYRHVIFIASYAYVA